MEIGPRRVGIHEVVICASLIKSGIFTCKRGLVGRDRLGWNLKLRKTYNTDGTHTVTVPEQIKHKNRNYKV